MLIHTDPALSLIRALRVHETSVKLIDLNSNLALVRAQRPRFVSFVLFI